jgi:hypothetical protein
MLTVQAKRLSGVGHGYCFMWSGNLYKKNCYSTYCEILTFLYCDCEYYSIDGYQFNELEGIILRMALQMAVVRGLHSFARKRSHADAVHTLKHLPILMIDLYIYKGWVVKPSPCTATFNELFCFPFQLTLY